MKSMAPAMKGIPALLRASDREAFIASKIEEHGCFGDPILREDWDGHTYLWNSGHAVHIATTNERPKRPLVLAEHGITEELCRMWIPGLDEERAMRLDLNTPQIVAPLEDRTIVLCGWWRLFKAIKLGITELPAIWLNAEDAEGCLVFHLSPEEHMTPEGGES